MKCSSVVRGLDAGPCLLCLSNYKAVKYSREAKTIQVGLVLCKAKPAFPHKKRLIEAYNSTPLAVLSRFEANLLCLFVYTP